MASASDFHMNVPIVEQTDDEACWAAAIEAMLRYAKQTVTQTDIRETTGISGGVPLKEDRIKDVFKYYGMVLEPLRWYTAMEIYDLAQSYGPLWIAIDYGSAFWGAFYGGANPNHILVLLGGAVAAEEGEAETVTSFEILDPWKPAQTRIVDAANLLDKMTSLSSKTGIKGHWIGHFEAKS